MIDLDQYVAKTPAAPAASPVGFGGPAALSLDQAAARLANRTDSFGCSMREAAKDLAAKLRRFGGYASAKQADFARRIVEEYSVPKAAGAEVEAPTPRPNTWKAVQGFARITIGEVSFRKKHEEALWWIKFGDVLVGRLVAEGAYGFRAKIRAAGLDPAAIKAALDTIEADPIAALSAHGLATGSCGCCGRELTDPESIARGIGPICADKLGGGF